MRGAAYGSYDVLVDPWITPAYAGSRLWTKRTYTSYRDHPRVCGEQFSSHPHRNCRPGSPPRMRGAAFSATISISLSRITPAYAGSSSTCPTTALCHQDHPRVCGEQYNTYSMGDNGLGSPPRMRGAERSIAGKTH